jgi:hypothetical protein
VSVRLPGSLVVAALLAAGPASASPSIHLVVGDGLPFTGAALGEAVALRAPVADAGVEVVVEAAGADAVRVRAGGKERIVPLSGRSGRAAARWVALALVDLAGEEATPAALPPEVAAVEPADDSEAAPLEVRAAPTPRSTPGTRLALLPTLTLGDGLAAGATVLVTHRIGAWTGLASLGVASGPSASLAGVEVSLLAAPIRVGIARRAGPLELAAAAVLVPIHASGGVGHAGLEVGAGLAAYLRLDLGPVPLLVGAGADAYATRTELQVRGQTALATPRLGAWVGVGVAWEIGAARRER